MTRPIAHASARVPQPIERLEDRRMLSVAPLDPTTAADNKAPQVTNVYVDSTAWTAAFRSALDGQNSGSSAFGVQAPDGNLNGGRDVKGKTLPWINLNQIRFQFDENVVVHPDDLTVTGVNGPYAVTGFSYDPNTFVATWTLDRFIPADLVSACLDASAATGVTDTAGNALKDNNLHDGDTTTSPQYCQDLAVLPGDVTRDGRVNASDLGAVKARANTIPGSPDTGGARYSIFDDVNGDGRINALDLGAVKARANTVIPTDGATATSLVLG